MKALALEDILYTQGFGTRRVCAGLVQQGHVERPSPGGGWQRETDAGLALAPQGLRLRVQGAEWPVHARAFVLLNKPAGTECSQKPSTWPSVYTLLPAPLRQRPVKGAAHPGVQAIGRLDQDTTGLLLLSDDGRFIHRMASPKTHLPKVYGVTLKHPATPALVQALLAGVTLDDDPKPVRAAACVQTGDHAIDLTLTEGKYHQVKRMVAAAGNRVDALHRSRIGALALPPDLAPGQWRWMSPADLLAVGYPADSADWG